MCSYRNEYPSIKRFINRDVVDGSITNGQSLNKYSYVQGNPVSLTDPFGLSPVGQKCTDSKIVQWWNGLSDETKDMISEFIPGYGAYVGDYVYAKDTESGEEGYKRVTRALDHSKPAVWVSEGEPNLFNRIFSGMVGKRGEASITIIALCISIFSEILSITAIIIIHIYLIVSFIFRIKK